MVCLGNDFKSANLSKILTISIKYVIIFIENRNGDVNQDGNIDLMDVINVCKFTLNADKDWNTIDK